LSANPGARLEQIINRERSAAGATVMVGSNPELRRVGSVLEDTVRPDRTRPDRTIIGVSHPVTRCIVGTVADRIGRHHRLGPQFLRAGKGYGGSCFLKDVDGFVHRATSVGQRFGLREEVGRIDDSMLDLVMERLRHELWQLEGKMVTLLGAARKPGAGDLRRTPAVALAELTKLLENTYRAVNIWEVIDAAATKPFGFQACYPGPGVGGHCIPLDPRFLAWRAREMRASTRFIDLAEDTNRHMPDFVARRIFDELNTRGKAVYGTRVLGLGIAFKRNIADERESPSVDVLDLLVKHGASVGVIDGHVPDARIEARGYEAVCADGELGDFTIAVVLTDHVGVDYERIADAVDVVFDTRGRYRRLGIKRDNIVQL
jgi:UDP-N-acetyl-D-mannosaminuronate dehydrogenase